MSASQRPTISNPFQVLYSMSQTVGIEQFITEALLTTPKTMLGCTNPTAKSFQASQHHNTLCIV